MTGKENYTHLLKESDRKTIQSLLGRIPTETELEILALLRQEELQSRAYFETMTRLDNGAKREVRKHGKITLNEKVVFIVTGGIKFLSSRGSVLRNCDNILRVFASMGTKPVNLIANLDCDHSQTSDSGICERLILRSLTQGKSNGARATTGSIYPSLNKNIHKIYYSFAAAVTRVENERIFSDLHSGSPVFRITAGKSWTKPNSDKKVLTLIRTIKDRPWFFHATAVDQRGLGAAVVDLIQEKECGILIQMEKRGISNIADLKNPAGAEDIIVIIQNGFESELAEFCGQLELLCNPLGIITDGSELSVSVDDTVIAHIPTATINFLNHVSTQTRIEPSVSKQQQFSVTQIAEPKNYSTTFVKLFKTIIAESKTWSSHGSRKVAVNSSFDHANTVRLPETDEYLISVVADNSHFIQLDPRIGGRLAIANANRQLACKGAKPIGVSIRNIFTASDDPSQCWNGTEILQGQEEALRLLELTVVDRELITWEDDNIQNIGALGLISDGIPPVGKGFKDVGDFISVLGSHRGELGGSAYLRVIRNIYAGSPPTVDLSMEQRLQEVVLQGIRGGLIKSAANVSIGGLAIAAASCILEGKQGLGARLFFSRKLRNDELLFGETQGLVVISLGENDIMEFERICMNIGVPSTTIGRVTGDEKFTFNDLINISVKKLRNEVGQ